MGQRVASLSIRPESLLQSSQKQNRIPSRPLLSEPIVSINAVFLCAGQLLLERGAVVSGNGVDRPKIGMKPGLVLGRGSQPLKEVTLRLGQGAGCRLSCHKPLEEAQHQN